MIRLDEFSSWFFQGYALKISYTHTVLSLILGGSITEFSTFFHPLITTPPNLLKVWKFYPPPNYCQPSIPHAQKKNQIKTGKR